MDQLSKVGTTNSTCPTCLRPIDIDDKNHIAKAKSKLQTNIDEYAKTARVCKKDSEDLKSKKQKITEAIDNLRKEIYNVKVLIDNKNYLQERIKELTDLNIDLIENIAHLNEHNDSFNDVLNQTKERLETVKVEIENLKKSLNLLDVVKFVVSEEGVKSYIVKKILQNFNSKLAFYLKKLDSNSICVFNEYFEEEIINDKGKICSYNNFSGAERKAIDLACLFSFIDMRKAQGNVHYNVSIYDELLDSSLDEKGVNLVLDILKERSEKQKESIFIISHRKESVKAATGEIIFLEKRNGITKRINYVE
jgi:DNA repair exonuclease SbcCD ATPase subunit